MIQLEASASIDRNFFAIWYLGFLRTRMREPQKQELIKEKVDGDEEKR